MNPALKRLSPAHRAKIKTAPMPTQPHPMKAKLYPHPFSHVNWISERKLDGERCIAFGTSVGTSLRSRNNLDLNAVYPEIRDALDAR